MGPAKRTGKTSWAGGGAAGRQLCSALLWSPLSLGPASPRLRRRPTAPRCRAEKRTKAGSSTDPGVVAELLLQVRPALGVAALLAGAQNPSVASRWCMASTTRLRPRSRAGSDTCGAAALSGGEAVVRRCAARQSGGGARAAASPTGKAGHSLRMCQRHGASGPATGTQRSACGTVARAAVRHVGRQPAEEVSWRRQAWRGRVQHACSSRAHLCCQQARHLISQLAHQHCRQAWLHARRGGRMWAAAKASVHSGWARQTACGTPRQAASLP